MAMIGRQFLMDHKSQPPLYSFNTSVSDHVRLVSTCKKVSGYQKHSEILCSENQTKTIGSRIQLASMSLLLIILATKFGVLDIIMYVKGLIGWFFHFCLWFWPFCFLLIRIKLLWGGKIWLDYRQWQLQVILQNAFYYPHSPLSDPEPTDESFACKNCGKMYSNPASLIGHLKYKCNTGVIITSWLLRIQYVFNYFL